MKLGQTIRQISNNTYEEIIGTHIDKEHIKTSPKLSQGDFTTCTYTSLVSIAEQIKRDELFDDRCKRNIEKRDGKNE